MGLDVDGMRNAISIAVSTAAGSKRQFGSMVKPMHAGLAAKNAVMAAGLAAEGETLVNRIYHLDRGYERVEAKLNACGAEIVRERA